MTWNERAKQLIQQKGYTHQQLMPVFGVNSRGAVGHYLNGRRQPRPEQLKRLADFLAVKVDDFFTSDSTAIPLAANNAALLQRLQQTEANVTEPLGRRYDWSNPGGLSDEALALKVLKAGRFEDLLIVADRIGIKFLQQVVQQHAELQQNPWLQRKLANIEAGLTERAA